MSEKAENEKVIIYAKNRSEAEAMCVKYEEEHPDVIKPIRYEFDVDDTKNE